MSYISKRRLDELELAAKRWAELTKEEKKKGGRPICDDPYDNDPPTHRCWLHLPSGYSTADAQYHGSMRYGMGVE